MSTPHAPILLRLAPKSNLVRQREQSGFSLIEVVIVIALSGLVLGLGLLLSMDVYRGTTFRSTRSVVVSALTTARGRAMTNQYQSPHGVCYSAPDIIIFRGSSFGTASDQERIRGNPAVTFSTAGNFLTCGTGTGVVFTQVSGTTTNTGTMTVSQPGHASETVSVNAGGTILW